MSPSLPFSIPFWVVVVVLATVVVIAAFQALRLLDSVEQQRTQQTAPSKLRASTVRILAQIDAQRNAMSSADGLDGVYPDTRDAVGL